MVGPANSGRTRQAFSVVNGGHENGGPPSSAGSECGSIEFTKEDVEALLNEKMKGKNKFNLKVCGIWDFLVLLCLAAEKKLGRERRLGSLNWKNEGRKKRG